MTKGSIKMSKDHKIKELYEQFRKPLFRFIRYKVADEHSAEEILNDVFIKAYSSIDTLKNESSLKSWLYRIASNRIVDYYRKKQNDNVEFSDEKSFFEKEQASVLADLECCMDDFFKRLPKQSAEAIKAVYLNDVPYKEYAEKNGIKLSTLKSHIHRGKKSMKLFFEECCSFERDRLENIVECSPKK